MASKKNPFASLLQSGRRVQAADFNKDYTVTSTVGQAGNYAIGFTRPIPISETSMGRLAQALGQTSGILKEFSDYQIKKDQLALQKQQLATQLEGQGIAAQQAELELENAKLRGAMTNETIKQQNIRLEMLQEQQAVAEEEAAYRNMSPQQQEEYNASLMRNVEETAKEVQRAETNAFNAITRSGTTKEKESINRVKALRRTGSLLIPEWTVFYQQEFEKRMAQVTETFTEEEAFAMGQEILKDFAVQKELEEGTLRAEGFYSSVYNLNKEKFSEMASKAIQKVEGLKFERKTYDLLNSVTEGNGVLSHNHLLELQNSAVDGSFFKIMLGQDGKSGLLQRVKNTGDPEALENFIAIHESLGSNITLDGKLYKETEEYSDILADAEDFQKTSEREKIAEQRTKASLLEDKLFQYTYEEALSSGHVLDKNAKLQPLLKAFGTSSEDKPALIREAMLSVFPSLPADVVNEIPDDQTSQLAHKMMREYMNQVDEIDTYIGQFFKAHTEFYTVKTELGHFRSLLTKIHDTMKPHQYKAEAQERLRKAINPDNKSGFDQTDLMDLNVLTKGALDDYNRELRDIQTEAISRFGDLNSPETKQFFDVRLAEADERLSNRIEEYFTGEQERKAELIKQNAFFDSELEDSLSKQAGMGSPEDLQRQKLKDRLKAYKTTRQNADVSSLSEEQLLAKTQQNTERLQKVIQDSSRTRNTLVEAASFYLEGNEGDEEARDEYNKALSIHSMAETKKLIFEGVTAKEALGFHTDARVYPNATRMPFLLAKDQYKPSRGGDTGKIFGSRKIYDVYLEEQIARAGNILMDATISKDLFMRYIPPVTDLEFGESLPSGDEDITKAVEQLDGVDSKEDLQKIANLYGFYTPLEFLQAQYKTLYHTNRNKLNKQ